MKSLYIGNLTEKTMNPKILIGAQIAGMFIMIGTADKLFTSHVATLMFIASLAVFVRSSIYIGDNGKWILKEQQRRNKCARRGFHT